MARVTCFARLQDCLEKLRGEVLEFATGTPQFLSSRTPAQGAQANSCLHHIMHKKCELSGGRPSSRI